jgi:putative flippase GtrA
VGRLISFLCAATFTYAANRRLTFRDSAGEPGAAQWARFVGANAVGGLANLGIYSWMIATAPSLPGQPVTAVAAGSLTGLLFNFALSRMFVFTARAHGE